MPMPKHSPLPTGDLSDSAAWPFEDGVDEIVIRVCRYEEDGKTPAAYQAIVKSRDSKKPHRLGIRGNPVAAIQWAIECYFAPGTSEEKPEPSVEDLLA